MRLPQRFRIRGHRAEPIPPPPWTAEEYAAIDWTDWHHIVATTGTDASLTIDGREVPATVAGWKTQTRSWPSQGEDVCESWPSSESGSGYLHYRGSS